MVPEIAYLTSVVSKGNVHMLNIAPDRVLMTNLTCGEGAPTSLYTCLLGAESFEEGTS